MAIRTLLRYRNLDSSKDLNDRYVKLVSPGVFYGGEIVPVSAQLKIDLTPWKLFSVDGMVVEETSQTVRLNTPAGQTTVIAVKAVYVDNNDPIVETVAIELSAFNSLVDIDKYVVMGHVAAPLAATQILSSYINYTPRDSIDKIGRSYFRGYVTSAGLLPASGNRHGDYFVVTDGIGGPINLYGYNGSWQVLTDFVSLSANLSAHRQNLFTDEKHLTDNEKLAVVGTSGTPVSGTNKLIDNADTRIPNQGENDALQGSTGTPSNTNRYMTQAYPHAVTEEQSSLTAPMTAYVEITSLNGPIYVGRSGTGSANKYFQFYHLTEEREFTRADGQIVNIAGVYKDPGLSQELDPFSDSNVDVDGFFLNFSLYIKFTVAPDAGYRLLYGKQYTFATLPKDYLLRRSLNDAQTTSQTVKIIEDIKGRSFTTTPPVNEQNIELRKDIVDLKEYISAVFRADHVVSDFTNVKNVPDFNGDFVENIGIPENYSFENTGLVSFSYTPATGTVNYSGAVSLVSVQPGHVFLDSNGVQFKVITIGVNQITIQDRFGTIPSTISTGATLSKHGSIKPDNNPRQINLSSLDVFAGKERIGVREIEYVANEFHPVTKAVAFQIRTPLISPFYREPRVRFYGGFFNRNAGVQSRVVCSSIGRIMVTGFFTDLYLLLDLTPNSPIVDVYVDGSTTPTTIDLSRGMNVASFGDTIDLQQRPVHVADNLSDSVPHTVEIVIGNSADEFVIYGLDLIRRTLTSALVLPGRAFVQSDLYKSDSIVSFVNSPVIAQGRGSVSTRYINRSLVQQTSNYAMTDFDGTAGIPAGTAVPATTSFTVTSGLSKFAYYKVGDVVALVTAVATEIKVIDSIGPGVGQVTFSTNVVVSGASVLIHMASTMGEPTDPTREYARYLSDQLGLEQPEDFSLALPLLADRTYTAEDGMLSLAGKQLLYTTTGIDGIDRALLFNDSTSTLRIRAVCNRMDILFANSSPVTAYYSVDGSPDIALNLTGVGLYRQSVVVNARYQTHEVNFSNSAGLTVAGIILHEPTLSTIPEGSLLGTQNYIARYAVGSTNEGDIMPIGAVAIDPFVSGGIYVNGTGLGTDWSYTEDFVNNTAFGRYFTTDRSGSYFEYDFVGEGFELEYFSGSDRGINLVSLNGIVANSTNFPVTFRGMNSATGEVDMYSASVTRKRIGISSLTYGKYTVRVEVQSPRSKNASSSGYNLNITSIYILNTNGLLAITPNKSYKEGYLYGEDQIRDERNFDNGAVAKETVPVLRTVLAPSRSSKVPLTVGSTSISVLLSSPMPSSNYIVTATLHNLVDSSPQFQPVTISYQDSSSFIAKWNSPTDSGNYYLSYFAITYN
jgi:hypothetical protein